MIIVIAGIIQKSDQILIARRAPHKHLAGFWEFPGGKLEPDETPQSCLAREILEEFDLEIKVERFFMENSYCYENGVEILLRTFFCTYIAGKPQLTDHDHIYWATKQELPKYNFAPADIPILNALTKADNTFMS